MSPRRPADSPPEPRLLPIGGPQSLAELVAEVRLAALDGRPAVAIHCDVDPRLAAPAELRPVLTALVDAAVAATVERGRASDFPAPREVVVTAVDTGAALEIEVADSGPDVATARFRPEHHAAATRLGGALAATSCAEGGMAVTLRLPRRSSRSMAA